MDLREGAKLAGFCGALAVKERVAPRLHVRPQVAECFLTDNCNLRCVSCACWRSNTKDELTARDWCDVLDQVAASPKLKVNFTGCGPLLREFDLVIIVHGGRSGF